MLMNTWGRSRKAKVFKPSLFLGCDCEGPRKLELAPLPPPNDVSTLSFSNERDGFCCDHNAAPSLTCDAWVGAVAAGQRTTR